ncbi:LuxR C-terminal-related transcriptional regulator [Rhodococcus opacus]|uniref:LuxR C-terminal-related transcriptional regulator n=1 Tax=Rhodococcus opacus TaxID=37919 RepID=UPI001FF10F1C|nr:LuxR C-terminal-related transcriptional regulator [Rhodococcus opacus]UOT05697.1 LuxR C-terminal-related transcriptional regulator [Rhodococcus opacus]
MARGPEPSAATQGVRRKARRPLLDRLRSSTRPVVVISGPAGAGKTALVEAWARDEDHIRILRISRYHNTAASLLDAIYAAVGAPPSRTTPEDVRSWGGQLTRSLSVLLFTSEQPCHLVLDGAEAITDPEAQLLLRDLVEYRPSALRLIVTSRHRSPSWLNRSRVCGVATMIKADDLRLSLSEVESLLGEDIPELGGWAMAVGLVADLGRAEADDAIRDYLRGEVMARVTTEVRHVLYAVSIAAEVGPALAIHLTSNPAAGHLLAQFASTTQFATVTEGQGFRLHPMLAKVLNDELATEHWESYAALRRRHADWLVGHGRLDQSTRLYVELGAVSTARTTLLAQWQRSVLSGRAEVVHDALGCLPPPELAGDSRLCVVAAMVNLAVGDHRAWQRWVDVAEAHDDDVEMEPSMSVAGAVDVSRRFAQALASGTMPDGTVNDQLQGLWGAISEVANGLCLMWAGEYPVAAARFRRAEVVARVSGDQLALVHALAGHALSSAFDGESQAVLFADEAIALADRLSPRCRWVVANAYLALATIHLSAGAERGVRGAANQVLMVLREAPAPLEQRTREYALELLDLVGQTKVRSKTPQIDGLSSRERRVLRALCGPLTLREIADELYVSHNTVKSQVSSIFRKLGVHDRAAAVAAARSWSSGKR